MRIVRLSYVILGYRGRCLGMGMERGYKVNKRDKVMENKDNVIKISILHNLLQLDGIEHLR